MIREGLNIALDLGRWALGRPSLAVRVLADDAERDSGCLRFEVENRSGSVTSLHPEIDGRYFYPSKLRLARGRNRYFVRELDRRLEPFSPVILTATPEFVREHYSFSWYRTYVFRPTRGRTRKVFVRNALLEPLGRVRYTMELLRLRTTGYVRPDPHSSIDALHRLQRGQGPH